MTRALLFALVLSTPLAAAEYERVMLPIAPMSMNCAYDSRYDVTLMIYNAGDHAVARPCGDASCGEVAAKSAIAITSSPMPTPQPSFIYLPKADAANLQLVLRTESGSIDRNEDRRFFTELPIIRDSDFKTGKMEFVGVRIDPNWRQSLRLYGFDGHDVADIVMRVYAMNSGALIKEDTFHLWPLAWSNDLGLAPAPSFAMECDLSEDPTLIGQLVRIELEPANAATRYWSFLSITSNRTQHFYTQLPVN
ncbi:MAG: hypothetical protein JWO97_3297 [Acidobacteria bacterium]|nr:hypothetical protein [Acidobacteriota bacterium]